MKTSLFHDRLRREAGDGVVAVPPGEFVEEMRGILPGHRQFDADQQFLRRQVRLINPLEEFLGSNPPFAGLATHDNGRIQRDHAGRQFGSGIGMREAAADGAAVADRGVRDMGDRFGQQRRVRGYFRRSQEIDMTGQRTDPDDIAGHRNAAQLGEFADIDDEFG